MPTLNARKHIVKRSTDLGCYWTAEGYTREQLKHFCLGFDPRRTKAASIGGEQEQGFEQAFSSLGYAYLKDKAPRLLDYNVGFQLADRNEDNTKAVGIFGFKIGKQWLYAPVFFLNGDLKGHELLYIKNQDAFVPMKENWVNYLMSRKPHVLGEGSPKDTYQLGGLSPNISNLSFPPPHGKYGADKQAAWPHEKLAFGGMLLGGLAGATVGGIRGKRQGDTAAGLGRGLVQGAGTGLGADVGANLGGLLGMAAGTATMNPSLMAAGALAGHVGGGIGGGVLGWKGTKALLNSLDGKSQGKPDTKADDTPQDGKDKQGEALGIDVDAWARDFLPPLAACATKSARFLFRDAQPGRTLNLTKLAAAPLAAAFAGCPDLEQFLAEHWQLAKAAWDTCKKYPVLKTGFDRFYGPDFFPRVALRVKAAADTQRTSILAAPPVKRAAAVRTPGNLLIPPPSRQKRAAGDAKVNIVTREDAASGTSVNLSDKEKEHVFAHGYLVKDERTGEEITKVYNTQVRQELSNPSETGLYEVLERPGHFEKMLVVNHPLANDGKQDFCTVVRLGGGSKAWINAHPTAVFTNQRPGSESGLRQAYTDWFKGLGDKSSLTKGGVYMAVNETGDGTVPFTVRETYADGRYKVDFKNNVDYSRGRRAEGLPRTAAHVPHACGGEYVSAYGALLVLNARPGSKLRAVAGELHVPESFKFLKLKDPPKPKKDENGLLPVECCDSDSGCDEPKPIVPGDIADIQTLFTEKTARMKLYGDGHEVHITTKTGSDRMPYGPALFHLIRVHGVTEAIAADMLKAAQDKGRSRMPVVFRLKYAEPYPSVGPGPDSPQFPAPQYGSEPVGYNAVNAIYPQEDSLPIPGMDSGRTDPKVYDPFLTPDPYAMNIAQSAAQSGQKEVFDTAMIGGLLKAVRQDSLVDRYLGDLMKAVDKLGRLLFMFYWHGEEFEDRYGKSDMPELEDSLRNAFEGLGDVVLFLKEKTIEPGLDDMMDPSIEETARN